MLELRPACEHCNTALPPNSTEAMICSFECTFCRSCVEDILGNVCPNCGGGFCPRPIRPKKTWKGGNSLDGYLASTLIKHQPVDSALDKQFARCQSDPFHRKLGESYNWDSGGASSEGRWLGFFFAQQDANFPELDKEPASLITPISRGRQRIKHSIEKLQGVP